MPVKTEYVNDGQGVIITAFAKVTGDNLINAMNEIFSEEEKTKNYQFGICDFSQIDEFDISVDQIISLATIHLKAAKINSNIIVGFAIKKPVVYGLVRMWQVYAEHTNWRVNISKTLPEITKWIEETLTINLNP